MELVEDSNECAGRIAKTNNLEGMKSWVLLAEQSDKSDKNQETYEIFSYKGAFNIFNNLPKENKQRTPMSLRRIQHTAGRLNAEIIRECNRRFKFLDNGTIILLFNWSTYKKF